MAEVNVARKTKRETQRCVLAERVLGAGAIITPLTHDLVWEADVDSVNVLAEVSVRIIY
eukprot:COSAG06_NODE_7929_length_2331_cov_1.837366_1_plen_59_part_00